MKRIFVFSTVAIISVACVAGGIYATPVAVVSISGNTATPVSSPVYEAVTITGNVWLREAGGAGVMVLKKGTIIPAYCHLQYCWTPAGLRLWRGCTNKNNGRGCQ